MDKKNIWKKSMTVGIIALFLGMSAISTARDIELDNITLKDDVEIDTFKVTNFIGYLKPIVQKLGTWGDNSWYITCVTLRFIWDSVEVKEVLVKIDNQNWNTYTSSPVEIEICPDGIHTVAWKWIDYDDREHPEPTFPIKIDKTPPTINLQKKIDSETQITFTANVNDGSGSGPSRVEFFLDDEFQEEDTEAPFKYVWEGSTRQTVKAVVFDFAGHTASDEADTKSRTRNYDLRGLFFSEHLQNLVNIFILSQKILLRLL